MGCMKNPGIATLIAIGAIILILGIFFLTQESPVNEKEIPDLTQGQTVSATPTPSLTITTRPVITTRQTATGTPTASVTGTATTTQRTLPPTTAPTPVPTKVKKPVDFTLDSGTPSNCGLTCRETTATITNTGDETAHSVCVVLEVFNEAGERILINSAPSLERCLGDIAGGSSRSETITINADCGFLAGKCVGHTLILKTRATSVEKSQTFPDSIMPV